MTNYAAPPQAPHVCPQCREPIAPTQQTCPYCFTENTSVKATGKNDVLALVFSLVGFLCCFAFSIPAIVLASKDRLYKQSGMAMAGLIVGIVGLVLNMLFYVFYMLIVLASVI